MADSDEKRIEVVATTFDVIDALRAEGPLSAAAVAERVNRSKSTAYYYLQSLRDEGHVRATDGGYVLDFGLLSLGEAVLADVPGRKVVEQHVDNLAMETDYTAFFAVPHGSRAVFIAESRGGDAPVAASLGTATPLRTSAYGKAILSANENRLNRILDAERPSSTPASVSDSELRDQLSTIDDVGIGFDDGEAWKGVRNIAGPVTTENMIGAIGITAPADAVDDPIRHLKARRYTSELLSSVKRSARAIENELTGSK